MKKVLFSVAFVAAFGLVSCGGPSMCDCVEGRKEMREKIKEADGDKDKIKEIEEEYKDMKEECEEMGKERKKEWEDADDDKKKELEKEWEEEAESCEK